jgi:hypothetical protein
MKSLIHRLVLTAGVTLAAASIPAAHAAKVTLDGYGYYSLKDVVDYYGKGVKQSGRYTNLGSDYYHKASYRMDFVTNHSSSGSGALSYELWAMPYYGATSGPILITRGLNPLAGGNYYKNASREGLAISLDAMGFPELDLWEYTRSGWKWRSALTFTHKTLL